MPSLKEVNPNATLSDFMLSKRVTTTNPTLFHVQDPEDGLWGLFDTSKGLIIPCEGAKRPDQAVYGFWLINTDDVNSYLFNPDTTASTPRMSKRPRLINERFALVDDDRITYLVDTKSKTVYGRLTPPEFEQKHGGFVGVNADIPSQRERHCWIWIHGPTLTMITTKDSQHVAFVLNINTGENSTDSPVYMA